ncbi:T-cell antigen CD7 isoform X2 [Passer domesticus]|uniref:T-cell antigen CD7 isoform X2 n=1 Tax=Passer domesticus TaxID=48849 RepID=UPI0030FE3FFF
MPWMLFLPNASLLLLLLPCFPALDDRGNEQSTDVISAWEGDSINITCPINGSQWQVNMVLRAIRERQSRDVIHCPKEKSPSVNPTFASRIEWSKEGGNLRTTLHRLKESDSGTYVCCEMVEINGNPKEIYRKTTTVVVKAVSRRPVEQSPLHANPEQGQSVSITCVLKSSAEDEFLLLRTHVQPNKVLSVSKLNILKVSPDFENRLEYSREGNRIVVTLHKLQEKDSDNYVCAQEVQDSPLLSASGTMVLVKEVKQACEKSSWELYGLLVAVALLFCALVCCTLYRVDVKKYFQKKKPNVVYEDMSYNSRRNTLVRNNTYSKGSVCL